MSGCASWPRGCNRPPPVWLQVHLCRAVGPCSPTCTAIPRPTALLLAVIMPGIQRYGPAELADIARVYSRYSLNPEWPATDGLATAAASASVAGGAEVAVGGSTGSASTATTLFDALAAQTVARIERADVQDVLRWVLRPRGWCTGALAAGFRRRSRAPCTACRRCRRCRLEEGRRRRACMPCLSECAQAARPPSPLPLGLPPWLASSAPRDALGPRPPPQDHDRLPRDGVAA